MGMGEPLLNLPAVLEAVRLLVHPKAFAMAPRSDHRVDRRHRAAHRGAAAQRAGESRGLAARHHRRRARQLVPLNRRFPLASLLGELRALECIDPRRPVFFEYTLIDGVNDCARGCAPARAAAAQTFRPR